MGFPVPGDAIDQSLDLNQRLIKNTAATFFMEVEGTHQTHTDVQPFSPEVEQYSIDEAFLGLHGFTHRNLTDYAQEIRATVKQWTINPGAH